MLHNKKLIHKKSLTCGFSLIELIVVASIIAIGSSLALPVCIRNANQAKVDRYTETVETGLFNLRAQLGTTKSSCQIRFPSSNKDQFTEPWNNLEFLQPDGTQKNLSRIECCNSTEGCVGGPSYRMISREGTPERSDVEVSTSLIDFKMSPPGTSAQTNDLTLLIRSKRWDEASFQTNSGKTRLLTRCIQVSGSGSISRGTWKNNNCSI